MTGNRPELLGLVSAQQAPPMAGERSDSSDTAAPIHIYGPNVQLSRGISTSAAGIESVRPETPLEEVGLAAWELRASQEYDYAKAPALGRAKHGMRRVPWTRTVPVCAMARRTKVFEELISRRHRTLARF